MLVLAHQCGGRDLGNHKAGIQSWCRCQEGGKIETQGRVYHQGHAALRNRSEFGDGQGNLIGGECHRFGVKISAR